MTPFACLPKLLPWSLSPLAALLIHVSVSAAPLPAPARAEVDALLSRLRSSGCQFNRNGDWHPADEARSHLLRKLDYLEKKDLVRSTEQFIDLAATQSSMSGEPYLVRCGTTAPVESRVWLMQELKGVRAGKAAG